ncbi:MAG: TonB-dependent receptor, partial [Cytophagales bacterium]|nr:TonB-dependent receptor [Cytophagales bacterium]
IDVSMVPDITALEEIVVVGYGTQKKPNVTGAISTVDNEVIQNRPVTTVTEALQGTMAGVTVQQGGGKPGAVATIQIRGFSTLNSPSSNDPLRSLKAGGELVIIDGVPGSLNDLNPIDIESISVLKDAAASSIYGARAADGVILVTTKNGKKGGRLTVSYHGNVAIKTPTIFPEQNTPLDNAELANLAAANAGQSPFFPDYLLEALADPNVTAIPNPNNARDYLHSGDFDWVDHFLDRQFQQNHNITISGGGSRSNYNISAGWLDQDGYFAEWGPDNFDRYNFRTNLGIELIPEKLSIDTRLSLVNSELKQPSFDAMGSVTQAGRNMEIYNPDGNYSRHRFQQNTLQILREAGFNNNKENLVEGRLSLIWNVIDDLKVTATGGYNTSWQKGQLWGRAYYKYNTLGEAINLGWINKPNRIELLNRYGRYYLAQITTEYTKSFNRHSVTILAGGSVEENYLERSWARRLNILGNELPAFNLGGTGDETSTNWSAGEWGLASFFGRINYDFDGKYLLEANLRYDGSSRFSDKNKWGLFTSGSVGWLVTNESFMQNQNVFSTLKFRASYGEVGNQSGLGLYDHIPVYVVQSGLVPFPNGDEQRIFAPSLPSQERTWETVQTINFGVEMGFLENRLFLEADYFIKQNLDMLISVSVPKVIGIGVPTLNNGTLETKGWEVLATWRDEVESIGLDYNLRFNIHDQTNKITELTMGEIENPSLSTTGRQAEGYPINSLFLYEADGYYDNQEELDAGASQPGGSNVGIGDIKLVDQDGDGKISNPNDAVYAGTTIPRYVYGFRADASWKGFDFAIFFQGVGKRDLYFNASSLGAFRKPWDNFSFKAQNDYWTPENPDARFPRPLQRGHNYESSTHWLQDASYIRLKNIQIGYTIPTGVVENLRVYFNGENIWEKTNLIMFDPEVNSTNPRATYPLNRIYSLGLNVTF